MNKVLIADDDFISLEVLKAMLGAYPIELYTATDGQQAIQVAEQQHPALILLDYDMPDMSGAEVCVALRQQGFAQTPIVAITGHQSATELNACREAGMLATLHKPVSPDALDELLHKYLPQAFS